MKGEREEEERRKGREREKETRERKKRRESEIAYLVIIKITVDNRKSTSMPIHSTPALRCRFGVFGI
jgi:hypothetical protein